MEGPSAGSEEDYWQIQCIALIHCPAVYAPPRTSVDASQHWEQQLRATTDTDYGDRPDERDRIHWQCRHEQPPITKRQHPFTAITYRGYAVFLDRLPVYRPRRHSRLLTKRTSQDIIARAQLQPAALDATDGIRYKEFTGQSVKFEPLRPTGAIEPSRAICDTDESPWSMGLQCEFNIGYKWLRRYKGGL